MTEYYSDPTFAKSVPVVKMRSQPPNASRHSSPESEDTALVETPPVQSTTGFKKRPAPEAAGQGSAKRSTVQVDQPAAARLQAAWRGFRVRGEGVAALARSQSETRREQTRAEQEAAVEARLRRPEYRQVSRCCPEARVRDLAELDERLERLVGMEALREYCADLRRDCLARAALGDVDFCVRNVLVSGAMGTGKKARRPPARIPRSRVPPASHASSLSARPACSP